MQCRAGFVHQIFIIGYRVAGKLFELIAQVLNAAVTHLKSNFA